MMPYCDRALEVEIDVYLAEPRAPRWAEFHAHARSCATCSAEIRAWQSLRESATVDREIEHPHEDALLGYADSPDALAQPEIAEIEAHLQRCAGCRDEVAVLRKTWIEPQPEQQAAKSGPARLVAVLAGLRSVVWHPAFAYSLVLALLVPTFARLGVDTLDVRVQETASKRRAELHSQTDRPNEWREAGGDLPDQDIAPPISGSGAEMDSDLLMHQARASRPTAAAEARAAARGPKIGLADRMDADRMRGDATALEDESAIARPKRRAAEAEILLRMASPPSAARSVASESVASADGLVEIVAGERVTLSPDLAVRGISLRLRVTRAGADAERSLRSARGLVVSDPRSADVEIRVATAGGERLIVERRLALPEATGEIVSHLMSIPAGWLVPGRYLVSVHADSSKAALGEPFEIDVHDLSENR